MSELNRRGALGGLGALAAAMSAPGISGAQAAWPALAAGGTAVCGAGLVFPNALSAAAATGNRYQRAGIPFFAPPWRGTNWEILLPTYYVNGASGELPTPNPVGVTYQTLFSAAGTPYPIKTRGGDSATLAAGTNTWCQIPGFVNQPNEQLTWFGEYFVAAGQQYPTNYTPGLKGQGAMALASNDLGGGREGGATSDPSKRLTGVLGNSLPSNAPSWGPAMARCKGWDGRTRVFVIWGDSRDWGVDDQDYTVQAKRTSGVAARGLVDAGSYTCAFANMSAPGAWAVHTAAGRGTALRWQALQSAPNRPFHDYMTSLNGNDINNGSYLPSLAAMQQADLDLWATLKAYAPSARIYHLFGIPWSGDADNAGFSSVASQSPPASATYPNGIQQQTDNWLRTATLPVHVVPIDLGAALHDDTYPDRWPAPNVYGTLSAAVSSGRTIQVQLPSAPQAGWALTVGVEAANMENFVIVEVTEASGSTYTLTTAGTVTKAHSTGDRVALAWVHSAAHAGSYLVKRAAAVVAARKRDGTIQTKL